MMWNEKGYEMEELLKTIAGAPEVAFINSPEGFTEAAERSLDSMEKVIYYLGSAELLMDAYEQAYEDGHYIPTRIKRNVLVKMLVEDTPAMQRYRETDAAAGARNALPAAGGRLQAFIHGA